MKWIIATNNKKKLGELSAILGKLGIEAISMREAGLSMEIEENGTTYEENSMIKAKAVYDATGIPAIADDSGLEVYALNNEPGVYSARYAGENATDDENLDKLLENMKAVPDDKRGGKFVSCVACVIDENRSFTVRGECEGVIIHERAGEGGFGYDPVFYVPEMKMTFSELPAEEKNKISHRGLALVKLGEKLGELREKGEI